MRAQISTIPEFTLWSRIRCEASARILSFQCRYNRNVLCLKILYKGFKIKQQEKRKVLKSATKTWPWLYTNTKHFWWKKKSGFIILTHFLFSENSLESSRVADIQKLLKVMDEKGKKKLSSEDIRTYIDSVCSEIMRIKEIKPELHRQ